MIFFLSVLFFGIGFVIGALLGLIGGKAEGLKQGQALFDKAIINVTQSFIAELKKKGETINLIRRN
jgi:hypothetical protein